jgi:hypothetical protein
MLQQICFDVGTGVAGLTAPGCPATFQQQFQQFGQEQITEGQSQSQQFRDEHQKLHRFRQGDVVALPAGVAHWFYNDGQTPIVAVYVFDVNNNANQLEPRHKVSLNIIYIRAMELFTFNLFVGFNIQLISYSSL